MQLCGLLAKNKFFAHQSDGFYPSLPLVNLWELRDSNGEAVAGRPMKIKIFSPRNPQYQKTSDAPERRQGVRSTAYVLGLRRRKLACQPPQGTKKAIDFYQSLFVFRVGAEGFEPPTLCL